MLKDQTDNKRPVYAVIGGTGFLGQHLLHLLLRKQSPDECPFILIIDKISTLENLTFIYPEDFQRKEVKIYLNIDITHAEKLTEILRGVDVVFLLAAVIAYGRKNKELLYSVNTKGIEKVIECAEAVSVKKMIHVSSCATLGCLDDRDKTKLASEDSCKKNWIQENFCYYARSKYEGEQLAIHSPKMNSVVAIPGILLGPGPCHHASILPFQIALNNTWTLIPQGGSNYVDVRDVAEGLIALSQHNNAEGKYLLASHNLEHRELLEKIVGLVNRKVWFTELPRVLSPMIGYFFSFLEWLLPKKSPYSKEGALQAFKYRYFSSQKANKELNWKPKHSLTETLQDTINWIHTKRN